MARWVPNEPTTSRVEKVRRVLKYVERKTIRELHEGDAGVVVGLVRELPGTTPLVSLLTRRVCIGYHLEVRTGSPNHLYGEPARDVHRCVDFELVDATGSIRVSAAGLELALTTVTPLIWYRHTAPLVIDQLIPRAGFGPYRGPQDALVTATEGIIVPGNRVLVCGAVTTELDASNYRDGAAKMALCATPTFPLAASSDLDLFRAGKDPYTVEELVRADDA